MAADCFRRTSSQAASNSGSSQKPTGASRHCSYHRSTDGKAGTKPCLLCLAGRWTDARRTAAAVTRQRRHPGAFMARGAIGVAMFIAVGEAGYERSDNSRRRTAPNHLPTDAKMEEGKSSISSSPAHANGQKGYNGPSIARFTESSFHFW